MPRRPGETRILVCDDLDPAALEILHAAGHEPEIRTGMDEDELVAAVAGVHALVVRSATRVTERVLEAADSLEIVGRAGVGVDNVDTTAATARGVVVMNTPTGNTVTTGELAIALLVALARHVPRADRRVRSGTWGKRGLVGTELTGKTLGVVGLGRIGRVVAERALGLRMDVVAHDPFLSATGVATPVDGVALLELDDLLARSDFVTLHVPLTDDTRGLMSRERLRAMKPGARLVNAARGGLVDEGALAEALEEGHLAGAALDVLAEEPPAPEHPLLHRDDVVLTPHLGAASREAQHNVAVGIAEQLVAFFADGVAHNAVNAPPVSAAALRELGPYVLLAERIGSYLGQRLERPAKKLEVTLGGPIAEKDSGHLRLSILAGLLRHQGVDVGVNLVNAPVLAERRGLRVLQGTTGETHAYTNLVRARVSSQGNDESHLVAGTVFGGAPRFVRVEDMHVDVAPAGELLVTRHHDRPGVLGAIGSLLGEADVNVRRVELGPASQSRDDLASAFLSLDHPPSAEVLAAIRALDPIVSVHRISL